MQPTIEVHILCYMEQDILPYTLKHYKSFGDKCSIVVHDSFSTDNSRIIAKHYGAKVVDWDTGGKLNDLLALQLKNTCWKSTHADWVIVVDADELIYFPSGVENTLEMLDLVGVSIVRPHGWEMFTNDWPIPMEGQIYDHVKFGAPDDYWYAKPAMFSPARVKDIQYSAGAHYATAHLFNGQVIFTKELEFTDPRVLLLHCKHLGPVERIARKYKDQRERLSEINVKNKWGNFDPPMKHALDKRTAILGNLQPIPLHTKGRSL